MKTSVWIKVAAIMAIVLMLLPQAPPAPPAPAGTSPENLTTVLVSFDRFPGQQQVALIERLGGSVLQTFHLVPTLVATVPESVLTILGAQAGVTRVERDGSVRAFGQAMPWGVSRVGAPLVYPLNKGTGIKVAVLDTGVDLTHPDLRIAGQVTFVTGTTTAQDDSGHGTMVAGIIGAQDNDVGVVGIAPEVSLYAVKVLGSSGSGNVSDIINGLQWAVDNGMQVVNMSFGGGPWPWAGELALTRAYNAGIVLVAGAGNNGNSAGTGDSVNYPARYGAVIAVGAMDEQLLRLPSSATGSTLELVAPGNNLNTTALGGGYGLFGSTSGATPHVSGAAALLIKSGVTSNLEVRRRLRDTAMDLGTPGWDPQYGKGLVSVYDAVKFSPAVDKTAPYTDIVLTGTSGNLGWYRSNVTVTLAADDKNGSGIARTMYSLDAGATWNAYAAPFVLQNSGKTDILARSWDLAGNDEGPPNYTAVKIDNVAPVVTLATSTASIAASTPGTTFSLNIQAGAGDSPIVSGLSASNLRIVDAYGTCTADYGPVRSVVVTLEDWAMSGDPAGRTYSIIATATDTAGNTTTVTSAVTVLPPVATPTPAPAPIVAAAVTPTATPAPVLAVAPIATPLPVVSLVGTPAPVPAPMPTVSPTPTPASRPATTPTPARGTSPRPKASAPPVVTLSSEADIIAGGAPGSSVAVNIYAQAQAGQSGAKIALSNMRIVDEYGNVTMDLGPVQPRSIVLESWAEDGDKKGRNYTISATATDTAGHVATKTIKIRVEPQVKQPAVDKMPPRAERAGKQQGQNNGDKNGNDDKGNNNKGNNGKNDKDEKGDRR